jgi:large subunit ribosomal protein L19
MDVLKHVESKHIKSDLPDFQAGDTVRVHVTVVEGDKRRTQAFQGTVISRRGSGLRSTFAVRKVSGGVGVERIFPLHSPNVSKIEVLRRGRVRRAQLFYLRGKKGKAARIAERTDNPKSR